MPDLNLSNHSLLQQQDTGALNSAAIQTPLRVLSIAHSAFGDGSSRLRYYPLAVDKSIDLTLVIPDKWQEAGQGFTIGRESGPLSIRPEKVWLQSLPKMNWYGHFYPSLRRLLRESSPDVLHLWEEPWSIVALQASILRDRYFPQMALVLETDQNILRRLPPPFESVRRYTLKRTDLLIARANEALEVSRACGYKGPASFVEYVVPTNLFKPTDKALARQEFGLQGFTIGYVGRLVPEKGLFTILNALKACTQPVRFAMMGAGPSLDALKKEIATLGLSERVQIYPPQPQDRVAPFMRALDALVLMSETQRTWKEQFGRVIVEAQACGTPVIGSDSGSIPYVTGDGGWIVPERDSRTLSNLLDRLASNPDLREATANRALANTQRFTPEIVGGNLREALVGAHTSRALRLNSSLRKSE